MAKKKKSKESEGTKPKIGYELWGVIFALASIIGIGAFGPVGDVIKSFTIFMMGTWWAVLILLILILGIYMLLKKDLPKFFSLRLIGLYILLIAFLSFSHLEYLRVAENMSFMSIMGTTIDNFMNTVNYNNIVQMGGGIIGAFFSWAFVSLLDFYGTYIVLGILSFFGLLMLLNLSFADVASKLKNVGKIFKRSEKVAEFKLPNEDDEIEEDASVMISSTEEIKQYHQQTNGEPSEASSEPISIINSTNGNYQVPGISLLDPPKKQVKLNSTDDLKANAQKLINVLKDFQIEVTKVVGFNEGPAVTQYELEIKSGTKVSRLTSINKEIALALAAKDVRIQAPIPGKSTVGIELPNKTVAAVPIREVSSSMMSNMKDAKIPVVLGKDIMGKTCFADLAKMPHLLVAGSTGSGKSVCINSFIASILMFQKPDQVKLMLVDPKKVELSNYNGVPHLMAPVIIDPKKASVALQKVVSEMERRFETLEEKGAKNISSYNEMISKENRKNDTDHPLMPYIVVIIDELADLMLVAGKEVEDSIMRITQMARAAGIHLIVATQRPSTDVITGVVKANIPSRIAFTVASFIDSRTILDQPGAEKLLGRGDMLYSPMGELIPQRIQGTYISDDEISRLINYVSKEQAANYDNSLTMAEPTHMAGEGMPKEEYDDPLYNEIVDFAISSGKVSASLLQRRFRLGYNRAARIIDLLEERGIIGPPNGSKPREVLVKLEGQPE